MFHFKKQHSLLYNKQGVLIASIVIMVKPTWTIVDPICTVLFSILVMFTTYRLVLDSLGILMEGTPTHIDPEDIEAGLLKIDEVDYVHDLHVWNLTAGKVRRVSLFDERSIFQERRNGTSHISLDLHL